MHVHPILIDKYVTGLEVEVDAISDGETVIIPGIMEHIYSKGKNTPFHGWSAQAAPTLTMVAGKIVYEGEK